MNQSAFRASNERLERVAEGHRFGADDRVPFVCECADAGCREIVMATIRDYERVRGHPAWFLVAAGHEEEQGSEERVVDADHGYVVVEKVGTAAAEAAHLDPREHKS